MNKFTQKFEKGKRGFDCAYRIGIAESLQFGLLLYGEAFAWNGVRAGHGTRGGRGHV
jgi:hypothetical protein